MVTLGSAPVSGALIESSEVCWTFKRNCALSPKQTLAVGLGLAAVSLGIGAAFWGAGVPWVLPFSVLEVLALGLALSWYARHAADRERIRLQGRHLTVDQWVAGTFRRFEFQADWVRVEPVPGALGLIRLVGQGRQVGVGRHLPQAARPAFERELRQALRLCRQLPGAPR